NRLGGNSLLDILVFGRAAANHISEFLTVNRYHRPLDETSVERAMARLARWDRRTGNESIDGVRRELQGVMERYCGVYRSEAVLSEGLQQVLALQERLQQVAITDHSRVFNTARIEALELENLMEL